MKTLFVNIYSEGAGDAAVGSLQASHSNPKANFQADWRMSLREVKEKSVEWQVADVEREMKRRGWKLRPVKTVDVEY